MIEDIMEDASDQLDAAKGTPIEWHVPTLAKASEIQNILNEMFESGIKVVVTPKP